VIVKFTDEKAVVKLPTKSDYERCLEVYAKDYDKKKIGNKRKNYSKH